MCLISTISISQGLSRGLAVDMRYDDRVEDLRRNEKIEAEYRKEAYIRYKDKYYEAVNFNNSLESPKKMETTGNFNAVLFYGLNYSANVIVRLENGYVTKINPFTKKEVIVIQSNFVKDFRSMAKTQDGDIVEIIFTNLF